MSEACETIPAGQTAFGGVGAPDDADCLIAGWPSDDHPGASAQNIEMAGGHMI